MMASMLRTFWGVLIATFLMTACVVSEPVPAPGPSTYDRAWNAALGALQDSGVQVTAADNASGQIRGVKGVLQVNVSVLRQADGRTRVQFDAKDLPPAEAGLPQRFSEAYERRMGR